MSPVGTRLGRRATAGEAPVPERAERLAQGLLVRIEALVDERPAAQGRRPRGRRVAHRPSCLGRRHAHGTEVTDDDVGAPLPQRLGMATTVDADDEPKTPAVAGLDAGERVLDHGGPFRLDSEPARGLEEYRGGWFALQPQRLGVHAIDLRVEEPR